MPVSHTFTRSGLSAVPASKRREFLREAVAKVGEADHRIRKPSKFTRAAKSKYGHTDRTGRYQSRKNKKRMGGLDFVWSGVSRSLLMGSNKINATAPSSSHARCDVVFNAPAFNFAKLKDGTSVVDDFKKANKAEVTYFFSLGFEAWKRRLTSYNQVTRKTTNG